MIYRVFKQKGSHWVPEWMADWKSEASARKYIETLYDEDGPHSEWDYWYDRISEKRGSKKAQPTEGGTP